MTGPSPKVHMHAAERKNLTWDHQNRFSTTRRTLFNLGVLDQPRPSDNGALVRQDYLEDTIHATILAYGMALISTVHRLGGHIPSTPYFSGGNVWTTPHWASQILHKVRLARYFGVYWTMGMTYTTTYNLLTGFFGYPINEVHNYHPEASIMAAIPTALVYAAVQPNRRAERAWTGRATPFVGRGAIAVALGAAAAVFAAKRFSQTSFFQMNGGVVGDSSYFWTLKHNAPSADIVAQMPYSPNYKEHKSVHGLPVRNHLYDPEYVAKAKAQVKQVMDQQF